MINDLGNSLLYRIFTDSNKSIGGLQHICDGLTCNTVTSSSSGGGWVGAIAVDTATIEGLLSAAELRTFVKISHAAPSLVGEWDKRMGTASTAAEVHYGHVLGQA